MFPPHECVGGCGQVLSGLAPMCGDCGLTLARENADRDLAIVGAATHGIGELEHLLDRHAEFAFWEIQHAHPPI